MHQDALYLSKHELQANELAFEPDATDQPEGSKLPPIVTDGAPPVLPAWSGAEILSVPSLPPLAAT